MVALDWGVVAAYCVLVIVLGIFLSKRASAGVDSYFASGRSLPWWLAGTSMVATTFATDTPLFVTGIVRDAGIWKNWFWWCLLISHLAAAFFFARWWKRSNVLTEVELTELRYDGKGAAALRGVKSVFWGVIYNVYAMGVFPMLGMVKIMQVTTGWDKATSISIALSVALVYCLLAGFWGVVVTDFLQFAIALGGAIILSVVAIHEVGGFSALMASHEVADKVRYLPAEGADFGYNIMLLLSFLLVQWWAFKNADGGGILVQRMIASRSEKHGVGGALWFCVANYVLRAWPWILVALASIVLLPDLKDPETAYPEMAVRYLGAGVRGIVIASFFAAFMSTMDTHINWGASYLINDLYRRFIHREASEANCLWVSRGASILLALGAVAVTFMSDSILEGFKTILLLTAGIGTVLLGRWLWWRTNAWSEIVAMAVSITVALLVGPLGIKEYGRLYEILFIAGVTMIAWVIATLITPPVEMKQLVRFYLQVRPPALGWGPVIRAAGFLPKEKEEESFLPNFVMWIAGIVSLCGLNLAAVILLQGFLPEGIGLTGLSIALLCVIVGRVTGIGWIGTVGGSILIAAAFSMTFLGDFSVAALGALFAGLALMNERRLKTMVLEEED